MTDLVKDSIREILYKSLEKVFPSIYGVDGEPSEKSVEVSRSKDARFGDYATNVALTLSKKLGLKPRDSARTILGAIPLAPDFIENCEIAGPGFINFKISSAFWKQKLTSIHDRKNLYGHANAADQPLVLIEFVSANPTGPLHVGHGRGAAVGDCLARLLRFRGYKVETEYYVNDAGNQMKILGRSLLLRYQELLGKNIEFPGDHYQGDYIKELAQGLKGTALGNELESLSFDEALPLASDFACHRILEGIQEDLRVFGVNFDRYFSEKSLYAQDAIKKALDELTKRDKLENREGAIWFKMSGDEDEKDRVLVRASGEPTYFAADIAYHKNKLDRGYESLVDIWGSDHHGYVPRVKAGMDALGYAPDKLRVMLVQFVNLIRDGKKISMSTRSGEFVTLREVLDEVGTDAARFFFLTKRSDSHLDFDLDLAKRQSRDNPVYYVQYVHARIASIFRIAVERNVDSDISDPDLSALDLPEEEAIMKSLADFPDMLAEAADAMEPHRVTFYLVELSDLFHSYYHDNKVLTQDDRVRKARLFLVEAVRQVIHNGLSILGVTAPDRM
ncbi:MAG: arginine--tRNA ligase [Syntrophaceae bacterium]|nr:arginine--tRNA ligase [Syntrophaceae bacterium]